MVDNFVEIEVECPYCNFKYITRMCIFDGMVDECCCGEDCYVEHHSKKT